MADPLMVSLNKVRSSAVDFYNDISNKIAEKRQPNNKKVLIGNLLNGMEQVPHSYGGNQTASAHWDK